MIQALKTKTKFLLFFIFFLITYTFGVDWLVEEDHLPPFSFDTKKSWSDTSAIFWGCGHVTGHETMMKPLSHSKESTTLKQMNI